MFKDTLLTCDKCGASIRLRTSKSPGPTNWLRHPELGDYCPPCKAVVLA